jgi:hypothetical protein
VREIVVLALLPPPPPPAGDTGAGGGGEIEADADEGRELGDTEGFAVAEAGLGGGATALADSAAIAFFLLITHNCLCTSFILSRVSELLCTKREPQSSQTYSFKFDTM